MRPRRATARHLFAAGSLALLVGLTGCGTDDAGAGDPTELAALVTSEDVTVIDVRTPAEFDAGHVAGAVNVDVQSPDFAEDLAPYPLDGQYVVYCRSGNRSAAAVDQMTDLGFTDVTDAGGLDDLEDAGIPLVS